MTCRRTCVLFLLCGIIPAHGVDVDEWLDDLGSTLTLSSTDGNFRGRLGGTLDLEYHAFDLPPPSLIDTDETWAFQPRATFFVDAQAGPNVYGFVQARIDRGFDPSDDSIEARFDEYAIRYTPWDNGVLNLQAGKFATVAGQWVHRHLSWENPLITAPLFYENVTLVSDDILPYTNFPWIPPDAGLYNYNPIIWGPSYATGASASGRVSRFEWAVEIKNAALSSRPGHWSVDEVDLEYPTVTGRVAWRPNLQWTLGLSASEGVYLGPDAIALLPPAWDPGDYTQTLFLADASYQWRHLQIWSEIVYSEFVVPWNGTVDSTAYFIEAKYKFAPEFYAAVRFNQQFFSNVYRDGMELGQWGVDQTRIDLAGTFRLNAHTQIQGEVDIRHGDWATDQTRYHFAARFTVRF